MKYQLMVLIISETLWVTSHQIYNYMIHGKKAVPNIHISYYDQKWRE